jgi:hypothetical protein
MDWFHLFAFAMGWFFGVLTMLEIASRDRKRSRRAEG